jgi:hypothetical protein
MHSKFHPIFGSSQVQFRSTAKAVTPFGGLVSLIEFFDRIGLAEQLQKAMPFQLRRSWILLPVERSQKGDFNPDFYLQLRSSG